MFWAKFSLLYAMLMLNKSAKLRVDIYFSF